MESQWVEILSVVVFLVILSMSTYYLIWPGTDSDGNPRTDVRIVSAIVLGLSVAVLFFFLWSLFGDLNSRVSTMDSRVGEDVFKLKRAVHLAWDSLKHLIEENNFADSYLSENHSKFMNDWY